jgi:hypothetical protein
MTAEEIYKDYTARFNIRERGDYIHKGEAITFAKFYAAAVRSEPAEGAEAFIASKIKDRLTFNAFDHVQSYPIWLLADWMQDFAALHAQRLAAQQVEEATKDCYPKDFFWWKENNLTRVWNGWMYNYDNLKNGARWKDTDEVFDYWTKNIKK